MNIHSSPVPDDDQLIEELGSFCYDPIAFVYWAFPWGEPGELSKFSGPSEWQIWVLQQIKDGIITVDEAIRIAVSSGHGIGKSALVAWIVWWAFSTFPDTRGIVTANTENQLKTKTWVEIAKWHRLFVAKHLFKCTATALFATDEDRSKEWRIDIVPWSERNTEAFAGLHNQGKRILIIFDEASAIPDIIHETIEGAMTDEDTEIIFFMAGNPTRNIGRFRECFDDGKFAHRWITRKIDSRTVEITNKKQLDQWIEDYGIDSDFIRVRVLGEFPAQDAQSFIPYELAKAAVGRIPKDQEELPIILGVDVARYGSDATVLYPRQGRDAVSRKPIILRNYNTMQVASAVVRAMNDWNCAVCMVDGGGVGGGVIDRLLQLQVNVIEVQFGAKPDGSNDHKNIKYANKRAEIWGALRDWLVHGCLPEEIPGIERGFLQELVDPTYIINSKDAIQLESKEMMKVRGVDSTDTTDALACTFAVPWISTAAHQVPQPTQAPDYNPFAEDRIYQ